jgi:predicted phosphoribosyltransferase
MNKCAVIHLGVGGINKIIEVSAACGVQLGTLLILKISVTAARCYKYP